MTGWIYKLTRWILGVVFIYAGSIKLLEPKAFAVLIEAYGLVPENLLLPASIAIAALEVAAGVGIFFDIEGSLAVIAGLLVLFIAVLGYGIWMGFDVDCGCFGPDDSEAGAIYDLWSPLLRDLAMLAAVAFLYGWRRFRTIKPLKITRTIKIMSKIRRKEDAYV